MQKITSSPSSRPNRFSLWALIAALLLTGFAVPTFAQDGSSLGDRAVTDDPDTERKGRRFSKRVRARMIERFDLDGDQKLSREERAAAREELGKGKLRRFKGRSERRTEFRQRAMERFDLDKNGTLDEAERNALREARKAKRDARRARFDTNGDGEISREERRAARQQLKEARQAFDADGDGELSKEERKAFRKARKAEREENRPQ